MFKYILILSISFVSHAVSAESVIESDTGDVTITEIGHASLTLIGIISAFM